jgi:transposase
MPNGIFFILRTGASWRDLPERYGPYTTVYNRFNRWAKRGIWGAVFGALARRSPDSLRMIDSTVVRPSACRGTTASYRELVRRAPLPRLDDA